MSSTVFGVWEDTCHRNFVWENWEKIKGSSGFVHGLTLALEVFLKSWVVFKVSTDLNQILLSVTLQ